MTELKQYNITLTHGNRKFSTLSNFKESDVLGNRTNRPWSRVIFLIHGFPDNNLSYNDVWPLLLKAFGNERVLLLAPLLKGYEPSSQGKDLDYKPENMASDINSFITSIAPGDKPVHLLGHDWGAIISFKTAQLYPDAVTSIVTLAIPYLANLRAWHLAWYAPEQIYYSSYFLTMQAAFVYGPRFAQTGAGSYLDSLWRYWSPTWNYPRNAIESVRETLNNKGVIDAATAYYRCIMNPFNLRRNRWLVDFDKVPTMIVGGETDGCMSVRVLRLEKELLSKHKNVAVKEVPVAGHFLQREDPETIAKLAAEWFLLHS